MQFVILWIKRNRREVIIFIAILVIAAFLRFYRIADYMTFLGDEGRDALIIKEILVEGNIPFIGPPTSVGNIYLGPLYYYMMAVSMAILWLNPVAAAGMVALIGVVTVGLIYYLARRWFGLWPAVLSSALYAISPVTITYSRSSWNPNPAPFFSLLAIIGLYQARKSKNFLWFAVSGGALAAALQMHYLTMILLPVFAIYWLIEVFLFNKWAKYQHFILGTLGGVVVFILVLLPLFLFEYKHDLMNTRAIITLFTQGDSSVSFSLITALGRIFPVYQNQLVGRYLGAENNWLTWALMVAIIAPIAVTAVKGWKRQGVPWTYLSLSLWLIVGLTGLSLYRQDIYDHYLGFLNPVPYLLLGSLINYFQGRKQLILSFFILVVAGIFNLQKLPLQYPPNNQWQKTQEISKFVISQSENKPFNFALIAERNYDSAYQYYMDLYGHKPKVVPLEITEQLFVVCEDKVCHPVGHPKYEIAGFGMTKIEKQFDVSGVRIYKLVANPEGKPF